jgi:hypothetical protein
MSVDNGLTIGPPGVAGHVESDFAADLLPFPYGLAFEVGDDQVVGFEMTLTDSAGRDQQLPGRKSTAHVALVAPDETPLPEASADFAQGGA